MSIRAKFGRFPALRSWDQFLRGNEEHSLRNGQISVQLCTEHQCNFVQSTSATKPKRLNGNFYQLCDWSNLPHTFTRKTVWYWTFWRDYARKLSKMQFWSKRGVRWCLTLKSSFLRLHVTFLYIERNYPFVYIPLLQSKFTWQCPHLNKKRK